MKERKRTSFPKIVLLYGLLLVGFKFFEYSYFSRRITLDISIEITAIAFLAVGIIVGANTRRRGTPPQSPALEKNKEGVIRSVHSR